MANDIDKTSPHYKGDFGSIYEVNKKFPTGGVAGDFVVIEGWAHYWNADRATWCVNAERDSYWDELITNIIEKFKLFRGATYMGVASLDTVPAKVIGAKMYYFATVAGTYKNFGDLVVPQGINVLYSENGSSWVNTTLLEVAQELGVSTKKVVSQKALNDALNLKANQSSVNEALAKKANTADVDTKFTEEKKRVDKELVKKFDKASVVQESGEAEDKVMSQKAVSDKLSDLSSSYTEYKLKDYIHNPIIFHPAKSACFFGDSITYGYDADAENKRNENNYVSIFEKLTGIECTNYGENGISFTRISYNVRKTNLQGFNYCFIAGGRNDAANGLSYQEVRETINTLCLYLQEKYPSLVVTFITPINEALQQHDSQLINIRRAITEIAEKYSYNVIQGDSMPFSNGNSDILTQEVFCSDKIHPNTLGYKIYGETLYAKFLPFNKPERYLDIPFTQGSYFDIDGVLQNAEWAYNTEFDVTAKQGQRIIVQLLCKKNSLARCGFKNSDGVVLKTFYTCESNKDVFAITSEFIPYDAKTCFLSTQGNIGSDFGVIGYSKDRDNCVLFRMQGWYSLSKQADNNVVFQFNNIVCSVNGGDNCSVLSDGKYQIQNDSVLGIDISDFQYNVKRNFHLESITLKEYKDRKETFFPLIYYIAEAYGFSNYVIDNRSRFNDVAFTQGFRYDETGELVKEDWASCASFDVSDKHGLYLICKICAVQDLAFCGFKDSEGNVLSFFNSFNRRVNAREAFLTIEKIPETAKTCFLSSQTNVFENNRPEVVGYMSNLAFMGELENDINSVRHKKVICDTDFCNDVDDAVAIRILCHYESVGAFDILGINMSEKSEYSSAAMSALLCESGRWNVPVAINKNATLQSPSYTSACQKYPRNIFSNEGVEDSLNFYLRALRTLPAGEKCDIICLGHLTCLADVLRTNKDLFNNKVERIYFMGGNFSGYSKEYNISGVTGQGAADATVISDSNFVLKNSACDIIFSPFVYGGSIVAGKILKDKNYIEDILYKMLESYGATDGRPVWDPITVLLAAQESIENIPGTSVQRGTVNLNGKGYTTFTKDENGKHLLVLPTNKRALIKSLRLTLENNILLENLGNKSPKHRLLKQVYTGATEVVLNITQETYMDSDGKLQNLSATHYGEADISEYVGKKIYIETSSHGSAYCGFKSADGALLSTFQTDNKLEGFEAIYTSVVPENATKVCVTTQYNIIPKARCFVYE